MKYILIMALILMACGKTDHKRCTQPLLLRDVSLSGNYQLAVYEASLSVDCARIAEEDNFWLEVTGSDRSLATKTLIGGREISLTALNKGLTYHKQSDLVLTLVLPISASPEDLLWATLKKGG